VLAGTIAAVSGAFADGGRTGTTSEPCSVTTGAIR